MLTSMLKANPVLGISSTLIQTISLAMYRQRCVVESLAKRTKGGTKMKKRNVEREILDALKQEVMAVGFPVSKVAGEMFEGIRSGKLSKRAKKLDPSDGLALGYIAFLVSEIRKEIAQHPPKNDSELDKCLEELKGRLRYRLRPAVGDLIKTAHEIFPRKKRGPISAITEEQKRSACSTIETLKRAGNTTQHAIRTVADSYGVTERNMRHIWQTKGLA
jgi:hypothetical protein